MISGIAGLGSTLVRDQKLTSSDIVLPTSSLTDSYTLCWTLAALYANATVALNSVAGDNVDLGLATAGADPTIVIAAPRTAARYVYDTIKSGSGPSRIGGYFGRKSLKAGIMPITRPTVAISSLSHLRLILIGQQAVLKPKLTSSILHELRLLLGTRVGYAFTTPQVAGAISQTNVNDHRDKGADSTAGPPLGSVEIYVKGPEDMSTSTPRGSVRSVFIWWYRLLTVTRLWSKDHRSLVARSNSMSLHESTVTTHCRCSEGAAAGTHLPIHMADSHSFRALHSVSHFVCLIIELL